MKTRVASIVTLLSLVLLGFLLIHSCSISAGKENKDYQDGIRLICETSGAALENESNEDRILVLQSLAHEDRDISFGLYNADGSVAHASSGSTLPLAEEDFEYDGFLYSHSSTVKEEQTYNEQNLHTETVTITTSTKNLEDILAELKPTIEYDDGVASGTLALDHSTIKTEAAGYKNSSYTVTATKNYTGLDRNDSSYIDKTVVKNGRTLSLSNVTWSVESTALVGDELVPATYTAVATYSGTAYSSVATGYITTAD